MGSGTGTGGEIRDTLEDIGGALKTTGKFMLDNIEIIKGRRDRLAVPQDGSPRRESRVYRRLLDPRRWWRGSAWRPPRIPAAAAYQAWGGGAGGVYGPMTKAQAARAARLARA